MPTFETPDPISVDMDLGIGDIRVEATDRADTSVEVLPTNVGKKNDQTAAEQTRVELANGHLTIQGQTGWRRWSPRRLGSVDVRIGLPAGSAIHAELGVVSLRVSGRLGDCSCRIGVGDIFLEETGPLDAKTSAGDISVDHVAGRASVVCSTGRLRIGTIEGIAVIKNSNGETRIGELADDARVSAANGSIVIDRALDSVVAKSARGDVRIGEVVHGVVVAQSAMGRIDVGVREGVAAYLDLHTKFGQVRNDLDAAAGPSPSDETVEVRASTSFGDVAVRRVVASRSGKAAS